MQENRKLKIIQIILGVSGTICGALFVVVVRDSIPPPDVLIENIESPLLSFLGISSIFFFPPYFAVTGLFSFFSPKAKEGELNRQDFMSAYASIEKSKKAWTKHLVACLLGAANASLMWALIVIR